MGRTVSPEQLSAAIAEELTLYREDVTNKVNKLSKKAVQEIVTRTQASAPIGYRASFVSNIDSKRLKASRFGDTYVWYVKKPDYRLTHLLEKGHIKRNGTERTKAFHFLRNACDDVLPKYEQDVKEACKG